MRPDLTPYDGLPNGAFLRIADLVKIFKLSQTSEVSRYVKLGVIPEPDTTQNRLNRNSKYSIRTHNTPTNTLFWRLGTLRKLL